MQKNINSYDNIVAGIDIGSESIYCAIGSMISETSRIKLLGMGKSSVKESFKMGAITNRNQMIEQLDTAVSEAEIMAGKKINNVYMSLTGEHIRCMNTQGAVALNRNNTNGSAENNSITQQDINRVLELTQGIALPPDRDILHTIPQEFIVDTLKQIDNPIGLSGRRLEGHVHLVTAATTAMKNLVESAEEIGIKINGLVFKPLAAATSTLTKDETRLGVSLIDIGSTTTGIAVYNEGAVRHSAVLPIGSASITNDIAVMLRISIERAEKIKIKFASAKASLSSPKLDFEIPIDNGNDKDIHNISEHELSKYVEARMEEIFQLAKNEINRSGINNSLTYGTVLTGGGSQLRNIVPLAKELLETPIRLGNPTVNIQGNKNFADNPIHSTLLGLLLWPFHSNEHKQEDSFISWIESIKQIMKRIF
jgi:cell division protein FtsA|tara:strand:- start:4317 stop:5585 length:1269 start_codon:yes stop_codon:yes gene_type:complete